MITAAFRPNDTRADTADIKQWDYGQRMEIHGLSLPPATEIHFGTLQAENTITRIGTTVDKVTTVAIPDILIEQTETIYAYIYLTDADSGRTAYTVNTCIQPRPKPQPWERPEDEELFREAVESVNAAAERAEEARDTAAEHAQIATEAAQEAQDCAKQIPGQVDTAKAKIDKYVENKEAEIKGDTGDVSFASFRVEPPDLYMYNDPEKTHILFEREGSDLYYKPNFPERG